ncbi:hypothetical protein BMAPRL20_0456 [Burkholderia mallei PRL-20]|nr:hypothetical protein BMAJHU_I0955 [Burkholderia mallei JHU]EEP83609.1 glyoxalase family protein family [Burkholderia mallei GB8 horse 4]EES46149.1 hypothetical protein BMAPRL20_0456 [Burkholderia mallei PRL-20]
MGVTDVERAFAFYAPLMEALRLDLKFRDPPDLPPSIGPMGF